MALKRIRLELARNDKYPEGSDKHGYVFVAPLSDDGKLDPEAWRNHSDDCWVHRFWGDEGEERGRLRHIGRGWVFDYDESDPDDNEPFFKLDKHPLNVGDYVSIKEWDGETRTFRVVNVQAYP